MQQSRKDIEKTIDEIKKLQESNKLLQQEFARYKQKDNYTQLQVIYDGLITKLTKKMHSLPIGHRYSGTFYLRKPYSMPIEFEKVTSSIFMKEDLVSWQVETDGEPIGGYYRAVYKEPNTKFEITREDAKAVYATKEVCEPCN